MTVHRRSTGAEDLGVGIPLPYLILFAAFLALKLYASRAPETFAHAGYPMWHLQLYSIVQDLGVLALVLLLSQIPGWWGRTAAGLILAGYIIDALLLWALFTRLTPFELIQFTDEARAISSFVRLPLLAFVVAVLLACLLLRRRSLRISSFRALFLASLGLLACLPWILPALLNVDPYLDFGYSNYLRFNQKLVWFRGVSVQAAERAATLLPSVEGEGIEDLTRKRLFGHETAQASDTARQDPKLRHPNVIVLLSESLSQVDSLRAGGDFDRLPQIDSIAATGITLTNLISDGSATSDALASLLLGVEPLPTACLDDASTARFPDRLGSGPSPATWLKRPGPPAIERLS